MTSDNPISSAPDMSGTLEARRYTLVAIILHWLIAILIIGMILVGWWMGDALHNRNNTPEIRQWGYDITQLHKSMGITILALSLFRLFWRLGHKAPALPGNMATWEKILAKFTHIAFYAAMLIMPLSGWIQVSASRIPIQTTWFHLFNIPNLPVPRSHDLHELAETVHGKLAWVILALLALHVGAALLHQFQRRDHVVMAMAPWVKRLDATRPNFLFGAAFPRISTLILGGVGLGAFAALYFWSQSLLAPEGLQRADERTNSAPANAPALLLDEANQARDGSTLKPGSLADQTAPTLPNASDAMVNPANTNPAAAPAGLSASNPVRTLSVPSWRVDAAKSELRFSSTHFGRDFSGSFGKWSANIVFSPDALAQSRAMILVDLTSAKTGNPEYDSSLPQEDWFAVQQSAQAKFETTRFVAKGADRYEAIGNLTLRGKKIPVTLPFTLTIQNGVATMAGTTNLDRLAFGIGQSSDPNAEYVARLVRLDIKVSARSDGTLTPSAKP